jgi:hypothetical protein
MQLKKTKTGTSKMKQSSRKMLHKVDRLVNTPGASRKLMASRHNISLDSEPPPTPSPQKPPKGKKRKKLLGETVAKARELVAGRQDKLQVQQHLRHYFLYNLLSIGRFYENCFWRLYHRSK